MGLVGQDASYDLQCPLWRDGRSFLHVLSSQVLTKFLLELTPASARLASESHMARVNVTTNNAINTGGAIT